jgi:hypothetical protein
LRTIGAIDADGSTRFEPLVPSADVVDLLPCLDVLLDADVAAIRDRARQDAVWQGLAPCGAAQEAMGDRLMLYVSRTGEFLSLNPAASVMWLGLAGGLSPDAIADEMRSAMPGGAEEGTSDLADDVWLAMCDWVWTGLLGPAAIARPSAIDPPPPRLPCASWHDDPIIEVFGWQCAVRGPRSVVDAIRPAFAGLERVQPARGLDGVVEILRAGDAYVVAARDREVRCSALELTSTIVREASRSACAARQAVMAAHVVVDRAPNGASILLRAADRAREAVFVRVTASGGLELLTPAGGRTPLRQVVLAGRSDREPDVVPPDAGFLEWMAADRLCVLSLDAESAVQFMRAANGLRFVRPLATVTTAHAAPGTR